MDTTKSKIFWNFELLVLITIILLYSWATFQRNHIWKDELSLWTDVTRKSPNKARGYNEVGMSYYEMKMSDKAIPFFEKSLSINPFYAIAHNNLGLCFLAQGMINQAIEEFKKAIQLNNLNGMYHVNLGIAYWEKGLHELARNEINIGIRLRRHQRSLSSSTQQLKPKHDNYFDLFYQ